MAHVVVFDFESAQIDTRDFCQVERRLYCGGAYSRSTGTAQGSVGAAFCGSFTAAVVYDRIPPNL